MAATNRELLTRGDRTYAKKKKQVRVESVTYDPASRQDYLTGFHKRKVARQNDAKKKAEEMAYKMKLAERKRIREERSKSIVKSMQRLDEAKRILEGDLEGEDEDDENNDKNAKNKDTDGSPEDNDEFKGFTDDSGILKKTTYRDGDNETDVVIEDISVDPYVDMSRSEEILDASTERAHAYARLVQGIEEAPKPQKPKVKKRKFRYLLKNERKAIAKVQRKK